MFQAGTDPRGDLGGRFHVGAAEIKHAKHDLFGGQIGEYAEVDPWLRRLDRDLLRDRVGELWQERIACWLVRYDVGVAEAEMDHGRSFDALKGTVDGTHAVAL